MTYAVAVADTGLAGRSVDQLDAGRRLVADDVAGAAAVDAEGAATGPGVVGLDGVLPRLVTARSGPSPPGPAG